MSKGTQNKPKSSFRRFIRKFVIISLLVLLIIFSFLYWGVYDEGVRAGSVIRISKKGVLFKTYEGQLNLQSFGALKGDTPFVETFDFSVNKGDVDVVRELESVSLTGERVNLHYIKRYIRIPWRGKTRYFIREVERAGERPFQEGQK